MTTTATIPNSEFLAVINIVIPDSADPAEVDRVRTAQGTRVKELTAAGYVLRAWRQAPAVAAAVAMGLRAVAPAGVKPRPTRRGPPIPVRPSYETTASPVKITPWCRKT